ncbi:hypothetical protein VKT23_008682 [Stygiomarasmius scandens]|uniref:Uncharacterized protein n=1 Tax=Marasmiellus scandens TaxID=2682957 RepID=A0ABR1JJX5_9AGAR
MFDLPRWKNYHYEAIRHFQLLKGYNPNTSNYARKILDLVLLDESESDHEDFHEWQDAEESASVASSFNSTDLDREGKLILIH